MQISRGLIIGAKHCPRVQAQLDAFATQKLPPPTVLYYQAIEELCERIIKLRHTNIEPITWCKIESPSFDLGFTQYLITLGFDIIRTTTPHTVQQILSGFPNGLTQNFDPSNQFYTKAWFLGFEIFLKKLAHCLQQHAILPLNNVDDILLTLNKFECQQYLQRQGIVIPKLLGRIHAFDQLIEHMQQHECYRVFLKPCFGASGAGIIAFEYHPKTKKSKLMTTLRHNQHQSNHHYHHTLKLNVVSNSNEQQQLINHCTIDDYYAEAWIPKPFYQQQCYDIRYISLFQTPSHRLIRASQSPITNLHLGNQRIAFDLLFNSVQAEQAAQQIQNLAQYFPHSQILGFDLIFNRAMHPVIFEINCFGDYIQNITHNGLSTHESIANHTQKL